MKATITASPAQLQEYGIDYVHSNQIINIEDDPSSNDFYFIDGISEGGYLDIPASFVEILPC